MKRKISDDAMTWIIVAWLAATGASALIASFTYAARGECAFEVNLGGGDAR